MSDDIAQRLVRQGITLPPPAIPVANYTPFIVSPPFLLVSGQLPLVDGRVTHTGVLGRDVTPERAAEAARACAINILAILQHWCGGDWTRVRRCIRLGGFFQVTPDFHNLSQVMNGASDLMVAALGENGKHVRTTVGVATLPMNSVAEVDGIFEVQA